MHSLRSALVNCVVGVAAVALVTAVSVAGPPQFALPGAPPETSGAYYVGVMGQVANPGVYGCDEPNPLLRDLVQQAGGLTADASRNVRIVRHGRGGQQTYYFSGSELQLLPGDIIVVDGRFRSRTAALQPHGVNPEMDADPMSPTVQIGLVDLIERPVMIELPPEQATLSQIVAFLHQSPGLVPQIRVVESGAAHLVRRGPVHSDTVLTSGTVLVFEPSMIVADALPQLPGPVGEELLAQSLPGEQYARRPAGPNGHETVRDTDRAIGQAHVSSPGLLPMGDGETPSASSGSEISEAEEMVDSMQDQELFDSIWNEGFPKTANADGSASQGESYFTGEGSQLTAASVVGQTATSTGSSLWSVLLSLTGCVVSAVIFAFLWSRARQAKASQVTAAVAKPGSDSSATKKSTQPTDVVALKKNLRVDAAHASVGPHGEEAKRGLLDRVLSSVERAGKK